MNVAIIPARGGSKRIPRKNVRDFCGRPMLAWPITVAQACGLFDHIVISTDDPEIAAVARAHGAQVIDRPAALADDHTPTQPVVAHAIEQLQSAGIRLSAVCCLYATAPFVSAADLLVGRGLIDDPGISFAFAATRFGFPIQRAFFLDAKGRPTMFHPEHALTRSQDLPEAFHDAGQFYWARPARWLDNAPIFGPDARPVLLPSHRVQDIDTPDDWLRAEAMMRLLLAQ